MRDALCDTMNGMSTTTASDLWHTRPVRPKQGRTVAGVCAGIGARYDVDPTLVKVAFAVATVFGGAGIPLYLIAVIAFPSGPATPQRPVAPPAPAAAPAPPPAAPAPATTPGKMSGGQIALLVIGGFLVISLMSVDFMWASSWVVGMLLMGLAWWLLYQRTPVPPPGTAANTPDAVADAPEPLSESFAAATKYFTDSGQTADPAAAPGTPEPRTTEPGLVEPAGLDTLRPGDPGYLATPTPDRTPGTTAAFALEDGTPATAGPRSPLTLVVTGLAVLVATAGIAARYAGADWFTWGRILALALAVTGLGLVVAGTLARTPGTRSTGLVPIAVPLAIATIAVTFWTGHNWETPRGGIGDRNWVASNDTELLDRYELTVGTSTLDLRDLRELPHDRTVYIRQGVGDVTVLLPRELNVRTVCAVGIGDVDCPSVVGGKDPDGPTLTVNAHANIGSVEMKR